MSHDHSDLEVEMVDLFAGPGGLDVAATWLGISSVGIEFDVNACATRTAAGLRTRCCDVRELGPADFPGARILTGGPPCQTYSVAGSGAGRDALHQVLTLAKQMEATRDIRDELSRLDDERTGLVLEPLRWALEAYDRGHPYTVIVLEQVPAVLPVWQAVAAVLSSLGYKVPQPAVLHAEQYGVPQTRRRAILIAHLDEQRRMPRPTHQRFRRSGTPTLMEDPLPQWQAMDAVVLRDRPYTVVSNYGTGGDPKARGRRRSDEPAYTVTGKVSRNKLVGVEKPFDRFTLSEAGRLQTFPYDYPWQGRDRSQQIGNAIPPRLAAHVLHAATTGEALDPTVVDGWVNKSWAPYRREEAQAVEALPGTDRSVSTV